MPSIAADESDVLVRNRRLHQLLRFGDGRGGIGCRVDRIGQQRLAPAMAQELAQDFRVLERAEEHFLVVAHQHPQGAALLPFPRAAQHAGAVGSAIDQVAKQNNQACRRAARRIVGFDSFGQRGEEVCTAMHVTHRIDPLARRNGRRARGFLGAEQIEELGQHGLDRSCAAYNHGNVNGQWQ
jgi:hypothetical protein